VCKSEHCRFFLLALFCVVISVGGIVIAVRCNNLDYGGRGGSIAVALSFAALFLTRDYGGIIQNLIQNTFPDITNKIENENPTEHSAPSVLDLPALGKQVKALEEMIVAIAVRVRLDAEGQKIQNRYLAFSSVVGTIAWGFGDWAAQYLLSQ
jgi:hypothetical protein